MSRVYIVDIRSSSNNGKPSGHYFTVAHNYQKILSEKYDTYVVGGPVYRSDFNKYIPLPFDTIGSCNKYLNILRVVINCIKSLCLTYKGTVIFQCSAVSIIFLLLSIFTVKNKPYIILYDSNLITGGKKRLFDLCKKKLSGIICPDETIGKIAGISYVVLSDYIYTEKVLVTENEKIKYDIGVFGIVSKGKGVLEIAKEAVKRNKTIIIAGRASMETKDAEDIAELRTLSKANANIIWIDDYIPDDMFNDYIKACRYIILNYDSSYAERSSGVIFSALFNGRPVIARNWKFASILKQYDMGVLFEKIDDIAWDTLLQEEVFYKYQNNIHKYLEFQMNEIASLNEFIK